MILNNARNNVYREEDIVKNFSNLLNKYNSAFYATDSMSGLLKQLYHHKTELGQTIDIIDAKNKIAEELKSKFISTDLRDTIYNWESKGYNLLKYVTRDMKNNFIDALGVLVRYGASDESINEFIRKCSWLDDVTKLKHELNEYVLMLYYKDETIKARNLLESLGISSYELGNKQLNNFSVFYFKNLSALQIFNI